MYAYCVLFIYVFKFVHLRHLMCRHDALHSSALLEFQTLQLGDDKL